MRGNTRSCYTIICATSIIALTAALAASSPPACAEQRTLFTPQGTVDISCGLSQQDDITAIVIEPTSSSATLAVDFVNFLVIVRTDGTIPTNLSCEYSSLSDPGQWSACQKRTTSEALSGPSLERAASALLDFTARSASRGNNVPSQAALAKAVSSAVSSDVLYVDPPEYFLASAGTWAIGWYNLAKADGAVLSSATDGPYRIRIVLPSSAQEPPLPDLWVSLLVAVTEDGAATQFHHMGFSFMAQAGSPTPAPPLPVDAGGQAAASSGQPRFFTQASGGPPSGPAPVAPDFVLIPEGSFIMGSSDADRAALPSERPQHEVYLPAYYIARTPVTNYQFRQFVAATAYKAEGIWATYDGPGLERHPVRGVSYNDAVAYCNWLGVRLPTEAEWEKAARGQYGQIHPWGNEFDHSKLAVGDLYAVGEFPSGASPFGLLDAVGGVWEWTSSVFAPYPFGSQTEGNKYVLRGGCWLNDRKLLRCAVRWGESPSAFTKATGFRIAGGTSEGSGDVRESAQTGVPEGVRF